MIVLGVILLVLAIIFSLGSIFNGTDVDYTFFGTSIDNVSVGGLFVTGLITGAVAMFALSLLLGGGARKRHKAVQRKREVRNAQGQAETLEQENARLRDEVAQARRTEPVVVKDGGLR